MKKFLLTLAIPFMALAAQAQFNYNFSYQTGQPYTPLPATGTTSVNGTDVWDEEDYNVRLPFNFQWNKSVTTNSFALALGFPGILPDTNYINGSHISGFSSSVFTDIADKGLDSNIGYSVSPIRMQITGTAPNRIAKLEIRNAGFYNEFDLYGTFSDSISIQYWLYETSNILELRYGPSSIVNASDYFFFADGPTVMYLDSMDQGGGFKGVYFLTGASSAPVLDSATDFNNLSGLDDYPANGTVYRFTPKTATPNGVNGTLAAGACQVYPTEAGQSITLRNATTAEMQYRVTSIAGQNLLSGTAPHGIQTIDISMLASGMYLVQVQNAEGNATFRIVKK